MTEHACTIQTVYDRYHSTLWRAWCALQDWTPNGWSHTPPTVPVDWGRWHRIDARFAREFDRAEHATHGASFSPLWCAYCKEGRRP